MHILFISHDGHKGGATVYLLGLIEWISRNKNIKTTVILRTEGEMKYAFEKICETITLKKTHTPRALSKSWIKNKLQLNLISKKTSLENILHKNKYDLAYLNTIGNGDLIPVIEKYNIPIITHIHELETAIRDHGKGLEKEIAGKSSAIVSVSQSATENFIHQANADASKIFTIPNFIPIKKISNTNKERTRSSLLQSAGIDDESFVVGFCGLGILRKGIDLVIPLATLIPPRISNREIHYIWIGGRHPDYPDELSEYDKKKSELNHRVHFIGAKEDAREWMKTFDIHVLASREESFGLVVLEAANLLIPTICFEKAGGASEFVRNDAGFTVPYLNLQEMANSVIELLQNEALRTRLGNNAFSRLIRNHTPDIVAPKILEVIESVMNSTPGRKLSA